MPLAVQTIRNWFHRGRITAIQTAVAATRIMASTSLNGLQRGMAVVKHCVHVSRYWRPAITLAIDRQCGQFFRILIPMVEHYDSLRVKYERAADRLWLFVGPDPPEPTLPTVVQRR